MEAPKKYLPRAPAYSWLPKHVLLLLLYFRSILHPAARKTLKILLWILSSWVDFL